MIINTQVDIFIIGLRRIFIKRIIWYKKIGYVTRKTFLSWCLLYVTSTYYQHQINRCIFSLSQPLDHQTGVRCMLYFTVVSHVSPVDLYDTSWWVFSTLQPADTKHHMSMVSCKKAPPRHAYAWRIGPFWQDTLDVWSTAATQQGNTGQIGQVNRVCLIGQVAGGPQWQRQGTTRWAAYYGTPYHACSSGKHMMTSSNGNIVRVTGHLCREFTGPRWISRTKANDAELWCFL